MNEKTKVHGYVVLLLLFLLFFLTLKV